MEQIREARAKKQQPDLLPDRIDMTKQEVQELMNKPYEEIKKQTFDELADYREDIETIGLGATIDKINEEIVESLLVNVDISTENGVEESEDQEQPVIKRSRRSKYSQ